MMEAILSIARHWSMSGSNHTTVVGKALVCRKGETQQARLFPSDQEKDDFCGMKNTAGIHCTEAGQHSPCCILAKNASFPSNLEKTDEPRATGVPLAYSSWHVLHEWI